MSTASFYIFSTVRLTPLKGYVVFRHKLPAEA
jgi:hypothetical protein